MKTLRIALATAFVALAAPVLADSTSTCTQHYNECVQFNKAGGWPTDRCVGYKQECMKTGEWRDRNRHFTNVKKK